MDNKIKREIEKIEIPKELRHRAQIGIQKAQQDIKKQNGQYSKRGILNMPKKIFYFVGVAVLLIGLFIGSAFLSPTMAEIVSKTPYLSFIFNSKHLGAVISDELQEKGYNIGQIGIHYGSKKSIYIPIKGSKEYYKEVKGDVERIVKNILVSRDYDSFSIEVNRQLENVNQDKPNEKDPSKETVFYQGIYKELKDKNYQVLMIGIRPNEKFFTVDIPSTENRTEKIKHIILKHAKEYNMGNYLVEFNKVDANKQSQESKWNNIVGVIQEGLTGKKDFKVSQVGFSNTSTTFTILIKTSIDSKNPDSKELGMKIEKFVRNFINSQEVQNVIKNEPFQIEVFSSDKKKIN